MNPQVWMHKETGELWEFFETFDGGHAITKVEQNLEFPLCIIDVLSGNLIFCSSSCFHKEDYENLGNL